ncbi:MAG TPA: hypothetical protein VN157_11320 [Caulobacter sp.]|nr:hypothetical protein [Caulobacter sp.]
MTSDTPINLADIAEACREAGYVVAEIDRGLEVSGSDDGGAFYLFPEGDWLQARCQIFDRPIWTRPATSPPCSRPSPAPSSG